MNTLEINYKITYTKRKTLGLYVHKDGSVEIRCSKSTPKSTIDNFIHKKQNWIHEKVALMKSKYENRSEFKIEVGSRLLFMGSEYALIIKEGDKVGFDYQNFYVPPTIEVDDIQHYIIQIYKELAEKTIALKVAHYAKIMKVVPSAIKINSAKTRWGSCSGKDSLNFSWLLVMADDGVIDYVVVHELAHIKQHNHSSKFWQEVEKVIPNYKQAEAKLKLLHKKISSENWSNTN